MIQIAGKLVRHIIEQLHGFAHTFAHVIRHVPVPFTTSETVLRDTPAFFATSRMPTMIAPSPLSLFYRCMFTCLPRNITFIYILSNLFDSPVCISLDGGTPNFISIM